MQSSELTPKQLVTGLLTGLAFAGSIALIATHSNSAPVKDEVSLLEHLAQEGDAGAQMQLGLAYRDGRYDLKKDPNRSLFWLSKAGNNGNAYAADAVANSYAAANPEAIPKALPWWRLAAKNGDSDAQLHLGEYLVSTNHDAQGAAWLRHSADRGNPGAREDLARLYRKETLPANDLHRGENPIEVLAERSGSSGLKALYGVWRTLKTSSPTTQSSDALISRARQGDPVAEYQLAIRYRDGSWAVSENHQKAIVWLKRSAAAGNPVAAKTLAGIQHSDRGKSQTPLIKNNS